MKIYQIDCSARKKGSASRELAKKLLEKIKKSEDEVIYRDLDDEMLFVAGLTESGMSIPENERTEQHKKMFELSDKLVKELKESDIIIISTPIYNFGPPATLKAWSDLAARVKSTFKYSQEGKQIGLLESKKVYLVITSGGTRVGSKEDYLTPVSSLLFTEEWDGPKAGEILQKLKEGDTPVFISNLIHPDEIIFDPLNVSDDEVDEVITIIRESMN